MKRDENGVITWSNEEEATIEMGAEARYRAAKKLEADAQKRKCKRGEHEFDAGKCEHCGADEGPKPDKPSKRISHII